jgi:hypothetical protein
MAPRKPANQSMCWMLDATLIDVNLLKVGIDRMAWVPRGGPVSYQGHRQPDPTQTKPTQANPTQSNPKIASSSSSSSSSSSHRFTIHEMG